MYWSMDSDITFVCLEAVWNNEVFDGDFVPCKNDRKDLYVQRKIFIINAIDQGVLATSKPLAVNNVPIWTTLMASHHILHVWRNQGNSKTRLVHQRYLHEVLYHIYGGGGKFVPPSPHHTNVYKFFATLRSCSILASFQQMTFKFGDILI